MAKKDTICSNPKLLELRKKNLRERLRKEENELERLQKRLNTAHMDIRKFGKAAEKAASNWNDRNSAATEVRILECIVRATTRKIQLAEGRVEVTKSEILMTRACEIGATPGWRWIRGFELDCLWDETGRVGVLTKKRFGDGFFIQLLSVGRSGSFSLIRDGKRSSRSFFKFAEEAKTDEIQLTHVEEKNRILAIWTSDLNGYVNKTEAVEVRPAKSKTEGDRS